MSGSIVWLASYPKSGNTWLRVLLQNLESGVEAPAVDINRLTFGMVASVRIWLDEQLGFSTADLTDAEIDRLRPLAYDFAARVPGPPRFFKIHDARHFPDGVTPITGTSPGQKAIYIMRNPLDVAVSYAHHQRRSIAEAIAAMADPEHRLAGSATALRRQVMQRLFSWSQHVTSWCDAPIDKLVLRYEDLQADPKATLQRVAQYLGWPQDPAAIAAAVAKSSFAILAAQEAATGFAERAPGVERFFRGGRTGDWRTALNAEQQASILAAHGPVMRQHGYLDAEGRPV